MSTLATIPLSPVTPSTAPSGPSEERGVMRNVSWNFYNRLTDAIGERSSIRLAFDGKDVEIMVIGGRHESLGDLLNVFVNEVCDGLDLDFHGLGSMTLKRDDFERGIEADLSYCFDPERIARCRAAVAGGYKDRAAYPIPDLAIKIDISPPEIDRSEIYGKLRAAELWRLSNDAVSIEHLDAGGNYVRVDSSQFLHVRADEVTQWLLDGASEKRTAWKRRILNWARAELRPRAGT